MKLDIDLVPYISTSGGILAAFGTALYTLYYNSGGAYFEYGECLIVVGASLVAIIFVYTFIIFTEVLFKNKNKKLLNGDMK
jgi:hypothetical protein